MTEKYFEIITEVIFFSHNPIYLLFCLPFPRDLGLYVSEKGDFSISMGEREEREREEEERERVH